MSEVDALFCAQLISSLASQGVTEFCLSPGSRSTPLALSLLQRKDVSLFVHFDERAMAFHALGRAKVSKKPVALVVTSGTAAGNLFPAVMEAFHSETPLIILTADRPDELRDCSANQATDQVKLFGSFVKWQTDLPVPSEALPAHFLQATLSNACAHAISRPAGPVHLNCPFREPFSAPVAAIECKKRELFLPRLHPTDEAVEKVEQLCKQAVRGIIRVGGSVSAADREAIIALSERLNFPLFSSVESNVRDLSLSDKLIAHSSLLVQSHPHLQADLVLHFGSPLPAKEEWHSGELIQISENYKRQDHSGSVSCKIVATPALFCEKIALQKEKTTWLETWQSLGNQAFDLISEKEGTDDASTLYQLMETVDAKNLFLSNSLPFHNAEALFYKRGKAPHIFTNRGLSGIDGNIATACGICSSSKEKTVAILGDVAALHDLNSLTQMAELKNFQCIILNNSGGGIFSLLPVAKKIEQRAFEKLFATSHTYTFELIAKQFGIPYTKADRFTPDLLDNPGLIELITDRSLACSSRSTLIEQLKQLVPIVPILI